MHQLEVLGLFQRFITMRSLVTVGDHIARESGQYVVGVDVACNRSHAAEGAQRAGYVDELLGLILGLRGFPAWRTGPVLAARRVVGLQMLQGGRAISGNQVENRQLTGNGSQLCAIAGSLNSLESLGV